MNKIYFEIKSRGSILIKYGTKEAILSGELVFEPPIFYADLNSFRKWQPPFDNEEITESEKNEIVTFMSKNEENITKIIFD